MKTKQLHLLFSKADEKQIETAIEQTEKACGVEVVPYVCQAADHYEHVYWKSIVLGFFAGYMGNIVATNFWNRWGQPLEQQLAFLLAGITLFVLLQILVDPWKRLLIGKRKLHHRTQEKAKQLFLEEEIFSTTGRTGMLVLLCLFEQQVVILCDTGVYRASNPDFWGSISKKIAVGMNAKNPTPTLIHALELIQTEVKLNAGKTPSNGNQLSNHLRLKQTES